MKIIRLLLIMLALSQFVNAQDNPDTSYWTHSGKVALNFSQVGFSNWTGGGDPSMSFNGILNYTISQGKGSQPLAEYAGCWVWCPADRWQG